MHAHPRYVLALILLSGLQAAPVLAATNGCLTRGPTEGNGIKQTVHYCAANKGMSAARFQQVCQDLKFSQLQGMTTAEARKLNFANLPSCPGNYKATCEGAFGEKMSLHYMADDTMVGNGMAKLFCESGDGKWRR